jgi:hypothetical protein
MFAKFGVGDLYWNSEVAFVNDPHFTNGYLLNSLIMNKMI